MFGAVGQRSTDPLTLSADEMPLFAGCVAYHCRYVVNSSNAHLTIADAHVSTAAYCTHRHMRVTCIYVSTGCYALVTTTMK